MYMNIKDNIKEFFIEKEYINQNQIVNESDSLLEAGILDSVGMIELIDFIENLYKISIDEDDLLPENFDTLLAIENYVKSKI